MDSATAFAAALTGAMLGVTITYGIGYKLGMPLIDRYGRWLALKPSLVDKTRRYYDKYGDKLLLVSFFIPGVRQFIGYFIGIIRVPYRKVVLYAYTGTFLWVLAFFAIGYVFGEQWHEVFALVEKYVRLLFAAAGCLLLALIVYKWRMSRSGK